MRYIESGVLGFLTGEKENINRFQPIGLKVGGPGRGQEKSNIRSRTLFFVTSRGPDKISFGEQSAPEANGGEKILSN